MAPKRPHDADNAADSNASTAAPETHKRRKGFKVGPDNLPDGTYRRKTQKIKRDLIAKAKVKKAYAKIKAAEQESAPIRSIYSNNDDNNNGDDGDEGSTKNTDSGPPATTASLELHPDRQAMLDNPEGKHTPEDEKRTQRRDETREQGRRKRRPKPSPFKKEIELAEQHRKEQEARQRERELKAKEREAMARARRPDQHGKRKLGRESKVLLSKIQRTMGSR